MRAAGSSQFGKAAWYDLVGRKTASGEILDTVTATAAHRWLPLASLAIVTDLDNGRSVIVKINDRGPYTRGRIIDLSPRAADALDMKATGVAAVVIEPLANEVDPSHLPPSKFSVWRQSADPATRPGISLVEKIESAD
jgi:rare lipoprotein A